MPKTRGRSRTRLAQNAGRSHSALKNAGRSIARHALSRAFLLVINKNSAQKRGADRTQKNAGQTTCSGLTARLAQSAVGGTARPEGGSRAMPREGGQKIAQVGQQIAMGRSHSSPRTQTRSAIALPKSEGARSAGHQHNAFGGISAEPDARLCATVACGQPDACQAKRCDFVCA